MADKLQLVGNPALAKTYKNSSGVAKTKGVPEVQNGNLVFPFDTYASTDEQVFVYEAPQVRVTASGANADIASVSFVAGQALFWDAANSKVTNVQGAGDVQNRFMGHALETVDYSGGVGAGNTLQFHLRPGNIKTVSGQHTTVAASDTVATPLTKVFSVTASFEDDVDGVTISQVTAQVGNQAGAPVAGSIIIKTWKATSNANPTLIAATTFGKKVNWVATGI
jgi:hypothetical protein